MKWKIFFNYRLLVWSLLLIAMVMGGGYLVIAYSYNLQKKTEERIDAAQQMVNVAREMEIELVRLRGFTLIYLVDKSKQWQDSISSRQDRFIIYLERARRQAGTPEELSMVQQISALFSNYELTINTARLLIRQGKYTRANTLIVHAAKDQLDTIHEKSRQFINQNRRAEDRYELDIIQTNAIIRKAMFSLGLGGILAGLLLGWIISRMVFKPINQLMLQVRSASGGAFLEQLEIPDQGDLEQLGEQIRALINRINQAQEALDKTKQLLQYSNKYAILGKVAPTVAHEIRNPLAAIKMLIYSLREKSGLADDQKHDMEVITNEINRMDDFIKNFLKFARPPEPVFAPVNPVDVVMEVIHLLRPKLKSNNIELSEKYLSGNIKVNADTGQIKQIFINLIINAMEAMPEGGNMIISTTGYTEENGLNNSDKQNYLVINIEDTGHGIPQKVLSHLFEPFIKGSDQGVGLGLSISQNIANIHKGWIDAKNKLPGPGAIFSVYLPVI